MSAQYPFVRSDYEPLIESVEGFLRSWVELAPRYPETIDREGWLGEIKDLEIKLTDFGQYIIGGPDNISNYLALVRHALTTYEFQTITGLGRLHNSGTLQIQKTLAEIKLHRDLHMAFPIAAGELSGWSKGRRASQAEGKKTFISHGRNTEPLSVVLEFVQALGLQPVVAEREASEGRSVNETVRELLHSCDCAIVIATAEHQAGETWRTSENVINEVGLAQEALQDRVIYLKEDKVQLPSNIREKVYETFTQESMDKALIKIARELKAFGLI